MKNIIKVSESIKHQYADAQFNWVATIEEWPNVSKLTFKDTHNDKFIENMNEYADFASAYQRLEEIVNKFG